MNANLKRCAVVVLAVLSVTVAAAPARAENTLEKILSAKKIRVAIDVANPPFGILDKSGQPDGSDVAVARQLAKDLGAEIEFVQVPSPGRITALLAGARVKNMSWAVIKILPLAVPLKVLAGLSCAST